MLQSMVVDGYYGCAAGSVTSSRRNHTSASDTRRKRSPCQALEKLSGFLEIETPIIVLPEWTHLKGKRFGHGLI